MATARRTGKRTRGRTHAAASSALTGCGILRLGRGIALDDGSSNGQMPSLVGPDGRVQLNTAAMAILKLCNGTRTREEITETLAHSTRSRLASDIVAFLDVGKKRGWIIEG